MFRFFALIVFGLAIGLGIAFSIIDYPPVHEFFYPPKKVVVADKHVIGFLPYWLIGKTKMDYSPYITSLSYFGLTLDTDGSVFKVNEDGEADPGWHALYSGLLDERFAQAKKQNVALSLLVFNANNEEIFSLLQDPKESATNTVRDVLPVMRKYGFTDLNIDIESTADASPAAREQFAMYVKEMKRRFDQAHAGTITIDISPDNILHNKLIDLPAIAPFVDFVVIMGYDFHYPGSYVTGAVGPLYGAGDTLEFDAQTAVELARKILPAKKIILGLPLYGYEWETIAATPRSAIIPGTGLTASSQRVDSMLEGCSTCSAGFDSVAEEPYIIYEDTSLGTFHQIYYPDQRSTQAKIDYSENAKLGGLALWALGYEGENVMEPLRKYKH
jgi:spore germination protein